MQLAFKLAFFAVALVNGGALPSGESSLVVHESPEAREVADIKLSARAYGVITPVPLDDIAPRGLEVDLLLFPREPRRRRSMKPLTPEQQRVQLSNNQQLYNNALNQRNHPLHQGAVMAMHENNLRKNPDQLNTALNSKSHLYRAAAQKIQKKSQSLTPEQQRAQLSSNQHLYNDALRQRNHPLHQGAVMAMHENNLRNNPDQLDTALNSKSRLYRAAAARIQEEHALTPPDMQEEHALTPPDMQEEHTRAPTDMQEGPAAQEPPNWQRHGAGNNWGQILDLANTFIRSLPPQ